MNYDDAVRAMALENSYTRLSAVLSLRQNMNSREWWRLLGNEWTCCDNISRHKRKLKAALKHATSDELRLMMTEPEIAHHANLPESLTVYRGCYKENLDGLSWTLDRAIALRFPALLRYCRVGEPLLVTGNVKRDRCAFKNDRHEQEIISPDVRRITVEPFDALNVNGDEVDVEQLQRIVSGVDA